ncbi:putative G-protein coupled receptor 75 [Lampetra fluviatilis]
MNDSRPGPLLAPLHASASPSHHLLLLPHSQPQQQQQQHLLLLPDTGGPGPDGVGPAAPALSRATLAACTLLLALLFCVGTYGNLVVFLSFFDPSLRKLRTHFDFLVLNLSFCDLFVSCATAPMLGSVLLVRHWARGAVSHSLCFSLQLTAAAFPLLSLQTVSVIAVQRLRLVLGQQPSQAAAMLVSHASSASALLLSLLLWALGLILAALAALRGHTRGPGPGPQLCLPLLSGGLVLYAYAADFLLCLVVLTVSYALIAHALRLKARVRKGAIITVDVAPGAGERPCAPDAAAAAAAAPCAGATRDHGPGPADDPASRMRGPGLMATAKDSKALLTCLVIALSALACCMPLSVALLQGVMSAGPNGGVASTQLEVFGYTLLFLKSGLNPFLYSRSGAGLWKRLSCCLRALSAPLLGVCTCCTCCSSCCCCCCRPKTRLRAVGRGNLSANCAKSSHHDTNSACILSPKRPASTYDRPHHHHHHHHHRHHRHQQQQQPQPPGPRGGRVDQACGPSLHSLQAGAEGRRGPGPRSERRPFAHSASSPINSRVEPYYSIYNSSPSPPSSPGGSVQHQRRGQHPRRGQRGASGCVCAAPALTELLMEPERPADRNMIPLPSV